MKKIAATLLSLALAVSALSACGSSDSSSAKDSSGSESTAASSQSEETSSAKDSEAPVEEPEEDDSEPEEENDKPASSEKEEDSGPDHTTAETPTEENTGDASLDNIRNQDSIGDKELLVVSFGTSYNDSRRMSIGAIEDELEKAYPDWSVRRAFTSNIIIDHINKRDGFLIDDVKTALDRAVKNNVKTLVVQPTHLMNGLEYTDLVNEIGEYADAFDKVVIGEPLLTSDEDFKSVEKVLVELNSELDDGKTAFCFMGHGTEAESNGVYQKLQDLLTADGYTDYYIGTVEATPSIDDLVAALKKGNYNRVVLAPLMVVAGDHANNDMAGSEDDSWQSILSGEGYSVIAMINGLGENEAIRKLYVEHARAAIEKAQ